MLSFSFQAGNPCLALSKLLLLFTIHLFDVTVADNVAYLEFVDECTEVEFGVVESILVIAE